MQATTCVSDGNQKAIVKALNTFKTNVQGLVEGVNKIFLLMVATNSGVPGVGVASHVVEELKLGFAHAPNPHPQKVAKAVADWEELKNHEYATYSAAQFAGILWMTLTATR